MNVRAVFMVAACVAASAPTLAAPQDQAAQNPPVVTDEIVVTANRLQEQIRNVPVQVIVITADDIRRSSAKTLDDVLRMIPGFSLLRQGNSLTGSANTRATSLRGLGGTSAGRTLVLVDDVPVNSAVTGTVFWPAISIETVDRIEVVKSATGVWGNLGMGGVINIITKTAKRGAPETSIGVEGGTQNSGRIQGNVRRFVGPVGLFVSSSYLTTGGFVTIRADGAGPIDTPVSDRVKTFAATLGSHGAHRSWSVGGNMYGENQSQGSPLAVNSLSMQTLHASAEFGLGGGRLELVGFGKHQNTTAFNTSIADDRASETPSSNQIAAPGKAAGGSVQWQKAVGGRHLVSGGTDVQWMSGNLLEDFSYSASARQFTRLRDEGGQQLFGGVFLQDLYQVTPRWRLTGALRFDGWTTRAAYRHETEIATGNVLRDDVYANHRVTAFDPSLGTVVRATDRVSLRASVNRAFRAPFPNELYHPFRSRNSTVTEANPGLLPERLLGVEAGVDLRLTRTLGLRVTGFSNRVNDPIINATIGTAGATSKTIQPCGNISAFGTCRQLTNAGRLSSAGADVDLQIHAARDFEFAVSYTFDRSRIVEAPGQPQLVGKLNRQSPLHSAVVRAGYTNPRIASVNLQIRWVDKRFEDDVNTTVIAPLASVDLNITRALSTRHEIYLAVQNLTDRVNELTHNDNTYSIVGPRQINAGLRLRF